MNGKIQNSVQELQRTITVSRLNYEIWRIYQEKENRAILEIYSLFFKTSLHAHFVAMIVSLYRLYETRKDTVNLPQLIKLLKIKGSIPNPEFKRIESEIKKIKPLWIKVSVLRNYMFAHRSNALDYDKIFKKAKVKPCQLKQLIDESKRILNEITLLWNRSSLGSGLSSTKDTVNLLEDLKQLNERKL